MQRMAYTLALATGLWLALSTALKAQLGIDVKIENRAVLEFETVLATITLRNDAETPLVIGERDFNATFEIVLGRQVQRTEESGQTTKRAITRGIVILPGKGRTELVDISSLFDLREMGGYRLSVQVVHEGRSYVSREQIFDVVPGIELQSVTHPMPGYRSTKLTYSLRYWTRRSTEHLFMVIKDTSNRLSYGTFDLGCIIRFMPPKMSYERTGTLTVVHQSGRERYTRSVFKVSGEGVQFAEQTNHLPNGRPYPAGDQPVGIARETQPAAGLPPRDRAR
jgi:hypothetical protein